MRAARNSAAYVLVRHVWRSAQTTAWQGSHADGINQVMRQAVELAIRAKMTFNLGDLHRMSSEFGGARWLNPERWYREAVRGRADSACRAIEAYMDRPPYRTETGARMAVDLWTTWNREAVKVTGLEKDRIRLCSYRVVNGAFSRDVLHRYAISREQWRDEMKRRKDEKKATRESVAAAERLKDSTRGAT